MRGEDDQRDASAGDPPTAVARALVARPDLWWTGVAALKRLVPSRWWRGGSHLPVPHRAWWRFRMVTAYGDPDARPRAADVIAYLEWCRSTRSHGRRPRSRQDADAPERLEVRRSG